MERRHFAAPLPYPGARKTRLFHDSTHLTISKNSLGAKV
jgi:hypothetical protein